ncbi:hypothetical protein PGIGA_G00177690 [Pangasianodon gigas]|uniref:Uncharacterized protein n=1 Tax=Pangasianodon gigas TaxID=30993 RepID=A0ACC5XWC2_PANGG|nr:hypothetical protein [Pangasianodon gigas]
MNVLGECYQVLFEQHGPQLFQSPPVRSAALATWRALRYCEKIKAVLNASKPFKVKVCGRSPVCLGAGTLTIVPVTCPHLESAEFLLEPFSFEDEQLPEGLLVSSTLVSAKKGLLYAPLFNVSKADVWLPPHCAVGTVQTVMATSVTTATSISVDHFWEDCLAYVSTQEVVAGSSAPDFIMPDFDGLKEQQALQDKALFSKYHGIFAKDEGCAALASALRSNFSHLRKVHLSKSNLGDSGLKCLSAGLENPHCKLETLRLGCCGVSDEGCAALASALTSNPSHLSELHLTGNILGDSGVKCLSAVLENPHCKLKTLRLDRCGISDEHCAALVLPLISNSSHLRDLDLSENNLGDSGVKHLSALLENPHCKLETLR